MIRGQSALYYEAHVTVEPVFDSRLEQLKEIAAKHKFRVADLLMKKRSEDTPERSQDDTFCTSRSKSWIIISTRTIDLVEELQAALFKVWRYKIEDTLLDSKVSDEFHLLD